MNNQELPSDEHQPQCRGCGRVSFVAVMDCWHRRRIDPAAEMLLTQFVSREAVPLLDF